MNENEDKKVENPFKKLEPNQEVPPHLKDKVMGSVNFSNLLGDLAELFTSNMANSLTGLFKVKDIEKDKPEEDAENEDRTK